MPYENIKTVLNKIGDEYNRAYANAVAYAEKHPDDVNYILSTVLQEIVKNEYSEAAHSCDRAVNHCYSVAIDSIWRKIKVIKKSIKNTSKYFPIKMEDEYKRIKTKRENFYASRSSLNNSSNVSENLFTQCKSLYDTMLVEFNMIDKRAKNINGITRCFRLRAFITGPVFAILLGVVFEAYGLEIEQYLDPALSLTVSIGQIILQFFVQFF